MAETSRTTIGVAIIGALATIGASYISGGLAAKKEIEPLQVGSIGPLANGQKLCSVWEANKWRDSLIVPKSWSRALCNQLRDEFSAPKWTLGCVYDKDISLGDDHGTPPPNNACGW